MSLTKKKASARSAYSWRPNFRDVEALPDLRVVRTKFFLPAIAISLTVAFSSYLIFQEYRAVGIAENIRKVEAEIATYEETHSEKVELNSEFMQITNTLDEIVRFKAGKLVGSDFLLALSSRLQGGMYLTRVEYIDGKASIDGSVQVPAEKASRLVNQYLRSLEEGDVLQGFLTEYKLTTLERDGGGNNFSFRIEVTKGEDRK